jgi:hypothetical protein
MSSAQTGPGREWGKRQGSAVTRRGDPALAANLEEIVLQCFEAGASVAYVMHDPPAVVLRDDGDEALETDPAGTALVVLFRRRVAGAVGAGAVRMEVHRRGEPGSEQGSSSLLG